MENTLQKGNLKTKNYFKLTLNTFFFELYINDVFIFYIKCYFCKY